MIWAQVLILAWLLTVFGLRSHILALLLSLSALVPVHEGVSLAMALRGLWGDPSITTLQLLVLSLAGYSPAAFAKGWRGPGAIVLVALALYASALGPWDVDLYRLGYQPWLPVLFFGVAAIAAWWRGQPLYLWLLTVDLIAFAAGLPESANLWDTLLDPLLAVAALVLLIRNRRGSRQHER